MKQKHFRFEPGDVLARLLETYILLPLFAIVLLAVVWLVTIRLISLEGETAERTAAESAREVVEIYEAQMIRNLGAIDQTLKIVKYAYELEGKPALLAELNHKKLLPPRLIFTVSIANYNGDVIASTAFGKMENVAQQPYFRNHQTADVDEPSVTPVKLISGDWKLQFSRRLNARDGAFGGIAMVSVDPDYFTSGYEKARLGDNGVLGLIGADGLFLAKRSGERVTVGEESSSILQQGEGDTAGSILMTHAWDRVERYSNARRVYGFPLTVVVGLSKAEQMEDFQKQKQHYLSVAAAASLVLVMIAAILSRLTWLLAQSRLQTRKNQETYYAASEASLDAVFVLRAEMAYDGSVADFILDNVNHRGGEMFGKTKPELLGKRLSAMLPKLQDNGVFDDIVSVFQSGVILETEWKNDIAAVDAEWLYRQVVRVEDGVVVIMRDISERKLMEERIIHMAHHDPLTGLPNRSLLEDRIQQAILHAQRNNRFLTVVFMDLDDFKTINDSLGHRVGDELLKILASRMVHCLRQTDTVVRVGGDEFVIVLVDQQHNVDVIAPTLQRIRDAIMAPVEIDGNTLRVTSSMGLARYPEDGEECETLLMNADAAMYQAKAKGANNYQYYVAGMSATRREDSRIEKNER